MDPSFVFGRAFPTSRWFLSFLGGLTCYSGNINVSAILIARRFGTHLVVIKFRSYCKSTEEMYWKATRAFASVQDDIKPMWAEVDYFSAHRHNRKQYALKAHGGASNLISLVCRIALSSLCSLHVSASVVYSTALSGWWTIGPGNNIDGPNRAEGKVSK